MKITRRQLRKLISETIYVNPQGDAFDNRQNDPTRPFVKAKLERQQKIDFLRAQGDERLRKFAPVDLDIDDDSHDSFLDQGIELANLVGDQGEFKPFEFSEDELELKDYAYDEMTKAYDALDDDGTYKDNTALQKGTPYFGGQTDYSEQFDRIEHQMSLRAKKVLKMFPYAEYFDVIEVLQEVPSYERLMNIIAGKEGDFSPNMQKLKKLPEKVANQHGVRF